MNAGFHVEGWSGLGRAEAGVCNLTREPQNTHQRVKNALHLKDSGMRLGITSYMENKRTAMQVLKLHSEGGSSSPKVVGKQAVLTE